MQNRFDNVLVLTSFRFIVTDIGGVEARAFSIFFIYFIFVYRLQVKSSNELEKFLMHYIYQE